MGSGQEERGQLGWSPVPRPSPRGLWQLGPCQSKYVENSSEAFLCTAMAQPGDTSAKASEISIISKVAMWGAEASQLAGRAVPENGWLEPQSHSMEQILQLLSPEELLASLPQGTQSRV